MVVADAGVQDSADPVHAARMTTLRACVIVASLLVAGVAGCRSAAPIAFDWSSPVGRDHSLTGRIWDVRAARFIDEATLIRHLRGARFVVLGETHDNVDHHVLQARILRSLVEAGRRPAVAFEMLKPSHGPALARHLAAHPGDAAGLGDAVGWAASGWPQRRCWTSA